MTKEQQKSEIIETADVSAIWQACQQAKERQLMTGIIGNTGFGKTTALKMYSKQPNVIYISYDKTMKAKHFFTVLLERLGIAYEGGIYEMVKRASEAMNSLDNPLLIIDEAGKLTHNMILYLHVLRDKTLDNCGIVLAGMPYFQSNLVKQANRQKEGCAEFFRRINLWHELQGLSRNEIEFVCQANGFSDRETTLSMRNKKGFGDLVNHLLLLKIQSEND